MLFAVLLLLVSTSQFAQRDTGELHLTVTDQAQLPVATTVELISEVNQFRTTLDTDAAGSLTAKRLPYGTYHIIVSHEGFARFTGLVDIRSPVPTPYHVILTVASMQAQVTVRPDETLLDFSATAAVNRIGLEILQRRIAALPGRSLPDLVNTQPGWLLEANGVLHPRGSEYQTQYVVDGLPVTDNRSPGFAPELNADDAQSVTVLTAGYPAEYGRKLGGVIEVVTAGSARNGLHGRITGSVGSFSTGGANVRTEYGWKRSILSASGTIAHTDRYLDPPVEENYTNTGTSGNAALYFEHSFDDSRRVGAIVRHAQSTFGVPNERVQEAAGQGQDRRSRESAGQFSYQHIFSTNVVGDVRGMTRDLSADLFSNAAATPIRAGQGRGFRELYVKGAASGHAGVHTWKVGADADFGTVHEAFDYTIADPDQFDPDTPLIFQFDDRRRGREQALFAQDRITSGAWTINTGIRWDHYRLVVEQNAVSPRLGLAWAHAAAGLVLRASYDRAFQTPAIENLLLASSPSVEALSGTVARLPVPPSIGDFFEAGFTKALFRVMRMDATWFIRSMSNFADDDLLLNTGVSFPIAFRRARIAGTEVKIDLPHWRALSGFVGYTHMRGVGEPPVTGGLFLGEEASEALTASDTFPVSQDQRHTLRARANYQIAPRASIAAAVSYGSGLPVEFSGGRSDALAQYGERIVNRVDFGRGRVKPTLTIDGSASIVVAKTSRHTIQAQVDVLNVTNRLNVINFAGLFSGTAVAPPRSAAFRMRVDF